MIGDYEKGSGFQGALRALMGERVVGGLCLPNNTIVLCFESGCAVSFRASDYGSVVLGPLSVEDTLALVKREIRDADLHQDNLTKALKHLSDPKCVDESKTCKTEVVVSSGECVG